MHASFPRSLKLVRPQRGNRGATGRKLLRHATDSFWDKPRETRQDHRQRVDGALWSPAALARANHPEPLHVGEHVNPLKLRIADWLLYLRTEAPKDPWSFVTPRAWTQSRSVPKAVKPETGREETNLLYGTGFSVEDGNGIQKGWGGRSR